MKLFRWTVRALLVLCLLAPVASSATRHKQPRPRHAHKHKHKHKTVTTYFAVAKPVCKVPKRRHVARCGVEKRVRVSQRVRGARAVRVASGGRPLGTVGPAGGLTPQDLATAYNIDTTGGGGGVIALIDAYNDPNIDADLQAFSSQYGLTQCTQSSGCLRVVNEQGKGKLPPNDTSGWSVEEAEDVEAAHAMCQGCRLLLVEANSSDDSDLATAENSALLYSPRAVSNSFWDSESVGQAYQAQFNHPGTAIVAGAGDDGFDGYDSMFTSGSSAGTPTWPADLPSVISVGATSLFLNQDGTRRYEAVWNGNGPQAYYAKQLSFVPGASGGGCSSLYAAPGWQQSLSVWPQTGCGTGRLSADVATVGDPLTGMDIYDSYDPGFGAPGWATYGGTSLSAPLIAAMYTLAGGSGVNYPAINLYGHPGAAYDVTIGGNGYCDAEGAPQCGDPNVLGYGVLDCGYPAGGTAGAPPPPSPSDRACNALPGFDGPTGVGSPNGLTMFKKTWPIEQTISPGTATTNVQATWTAVGVSDPFPGGTVTSYSWNWGDNSPVTTSSTNGSTHTYTAPGSYKIVTTLTDNYGVSGSAGHTVTVK